jgi:hypothetical protein
MLCVLKIRNIANMIIFDVMFDYFPLVRIYSSENYTDKLINFLSNYLFIMYM